MIYLLILIIPLLIYAVLAAAILFHLKRYGIAGDFTKKLIIGFLIISAVLIIFTAWAFFSIPWNELNLSEMMIRNAPNSFPFFYQP